MKQPRILFIGTSFFDIEDQIILSFKKNGYNVDYFNDRPNNSSIVKSLIKISKTLSYPLNEKYISEILKRTEDISYEKIFILNGKIINKRMLLMLKEKHPQSEFVFYTYDSLSLYPMGIENLYMYDRIYSFDRRDVERYKNLILLPLFFTKEIEDIKTEVKYSYDLLSVCTAHPNRYEVIKSIFPKLKSKGIKIFSFLYLNKLQFIYNKLFIKQFKASKTSEFQFVSMTPKENRNLISMSRAIFDVEHSNQSGLTMRTIEALGARRKLITTNAEIKKYNFYSENNILVLTKETSINQIIDFLKKPFKPVEEKVYESYKIDMWSKVILGIEKEGEYLK